MRTVLPESLLMLASACRAPLYVVGGSVRDHLAGLTSKTYDWDICSPMSADELIAAAESCRFQVKAVYRNTGTVKLQSSDKTDFEYSCFRSDKYVRGTHVPVEIFFTDDIRLDALRRDFTANAVYYDIRAEKYVDPLDGISAIRKKRLTTVAPAQKVFGEDGLRLMRLARQAAQLGFSPDEECFLGAKQNATLIDDISSERIFAELNSLLIADQKHGNADGPYQGLTLLEQMSVLARILPELALGKDMQQRPDFHKYDVLEHSLRAVKYADPRIRLAALLHDIGKPTCMLRDGNSHGHHVEGADLTRAVLTRWKAPKKSIERIPALIEWHMYDFDCKAKENKLRRFFISHYDILEDLMLLKQADFSACLDDTSVAPTCLRWQRLLMDMREKNTPFTLKQLAVTGKDILDIGIPPAHIASILQQLLLHCAITPADNKKERLLFLVPGIKKSLFS